MFTPERCVNDAISHKMTFEVTFSSESGFANASQLQSFQGWKSKSKVAHVEIKSARDDFGFGLARDDFNPELLVKNLDLGLTFQPKVKLLVTILILCNKITFW